MPITLFGCAAELVFSRVPAQYPDLKIALSEGGIGWIPYFLERADYVTSTTTTGRTRTSAASSRATCSASTSSRASSTTPRGVRNRDLIGIDTITWECDYPHSDYDLADHARRAVAKPDSVPAGCRDDEIDKITHENVLRHFRFDGMQKMGGRATCTVGALRELAKDVDTTPVSLAGLKPIGYAPGKIVHVARRHGARQRLSRSRRTSNDGGCFSWNDTPKAGQARVVSTKEGSMIDVLKGVRVVEVAQWWFVPSAGAVLADWGADVIKIEHPVRGDAQRGLVTPRLLPRRSAASTS